MTGTKTLSSVLGLLLFALAAGCWIPLPEETAVVVEVYDSEGRPVDGVAVNVDGGIYITGENLGSEGRVFRSLSSAGNHTVSIIPASLVDPQGGRRHVPLASLVSGEPAPLSYQDRPFAGGNDAIVVPVAKGFISVVTIYLTDALAAPLDNQWLTDGNAVSDWRGTENGQDEFSAQPRPTFWWRPDPSMGTSVLTTFQLWQDRDGDLRYPLGVRNPAEYAQATNPLLAGYLPPIWQVPHAGVQRADGVSGGRVRLWASEAVGADRYDVYYAPTAAWHSIWENNPVIRGVSPSATSDPELLLVELGPGTANAGPLLRNGISYTFALRARDTASNLDTLLTASGRSTRAAIPPGFALGAVSSLSVADTNNGGQLTLAFSCSAAQNVRVYAAPFGEWRLRPFDPRYLRDTTTCATGSNIFTLEGLVSRQALGKTPITYIVGLEPFDAFNNVGAAATVLGTPTSGASLDTVQPFWANGGSIIPTTTGQPPGQVRVTFDFVNDPAEPSPFFRRLYHGPVSLPASNAEARAYTDLLNNTVTELTFGDIPNGVPYLFAMQALDAYGNASTLRTASITLSDPLNGTGPEWITDTQALFFSVVYPSAGTVTHPLGVAYDYHGPALATSETGEYVWRVVEDNGDPAQRAESKLGAFYAWSGFYYATTVSSGLNMTNPSTQVRHRDVFSFVEQSLTRASVMGAYFDSNADDGYRQRTVQGFAAMLEGGSNGTNQLVLRYVTDEDGVVTDVGLDTNGNGQVDTYGALLEVTAVNSQYVNRSPSSYPPHLQRKAFLTLYREDLDEMFFFPGSALGVSFNGSLATPDALDPEW